MMVFISVLNVVKNLQSFVVGSRFYNNFLKTSFKSSVLFNGFSIFVHCRCANALDFASRKRRFENVCGIHASRRGTCTYNGVYFVNEKNDVGIFAQLFKKTAYAFFKLTAIFCACHKGNHVESNHTFVKKSAGHFALFYS